MRRPAIGVLAAVMSGLTATTGAAASSSGSRIAACPHSPTSAQRASVQDMRSAILCLVNQERRRFHLPLLHEDTKLNRSAQGHTDDMVQRGYFSHNSPNGADPSQRITAAGYRWSWSGENIAAGYPTPVAVMTGWMSDVGHCQNILRPQFHDIGIGMNPHGISTFGTGPATWTQDFGLRAGARAPSMNSRPANGCPRGL